MLTLFAQWQANQIARKSYELSITPRLSIATNFRVAYVGSSSSRQDEVVCVPITVFNNSGAYALDVQFDLLMSYAKGMDTSLNEYLKKENRPLPYQNRLGPGEKWESRTDEFCMSVVNNAVETYKAGKEECKAQINLTWRDIQRKEHRLVHLARLVYAPPIERSGGYFWFKHIVSYDTLSGLLDKWRVKHYWRSPIRF